MKELESLLLRIVSPRGNKQAGKFVKSENLRSKLNQLIKAEDDDRRARLMGGRTAKRRIKSKSNRGRGAGVLAGSFERAINLRGTIGGYDYFASLKKNGEISYAGTSYQSPTAAASAAVGD